MQKKRLISTILASIGLLAIGGFAVWSFLFTGESILEVSSQAPVVYTSYLDINMIDSTNEMQEVLDYVIAVSGTNNIIDYTAIRECEILDTDLEDGCNELLTDNNIDLTPANFTLNYGESQQINLRYTIPEYSCPQKINCDITIDQA